MKKKVFVVMGLSVLVSSFCFNILESNAYAAPVENEGQGILEKSTQSSDTQNDLNELNISVEENDNSDKTAEEISKELEEQMKKEAEESGATYGPGTEAVVTDLELMIDETTFPDDAFRALVKKNFDLNSDGVLNLAEINAVTTIGIPDIGTIFNLEGIQYFDKAQTIFISGTAVSSINVSGMKNLISIRYLNNPNLKMLDFRNCDNLQYADHSVNQEVVYISPGMLNFVACSNIHKHTGNLVIDLNGAYTVNTDGTKTVDLSTVLSPELISVFEQHVQPGYDTITKILTIPENDIKTLFVAGEDGYGKDSKWTFYTGTDVTISYITDGGTSIPLEDLIAGTLATKPFIPEKDGYMFDGWYTDATFTTPFDFSQPINVDTIVYVKWRKAEVTVKYESNGGSSVNDEVLSSGGAATKPVNPTKSGYVFEGWYTDNEFKTPYDFNKAVDEDITLYAKWRKVSSSGGSTNTSNTNSSTTIKENETKPTCPDNNSKNSTKAEVKEKSGQSVVKQTGSTYLNNLMVLGMLVVISISGTVFYTVKIENKEA